MTGLIYAVGCEGSSLVKIGFTAQLETRLVSLRYGSAAALTLLWSAPGDRPTERAIHELLKDRRRHGEWFDFPDSDTVPVVEEAYATAQRDRRPAKVAPAQPSLLFRLADSLLKGQLAERIAGYRRANIPYGAIAHLLEQDGITVCQETLRQWGHRYGLESKAS